jgi:hypothetical protein
MSQSRLRRQVVDGRRSRRVLQPLAESLETRALLATTITHPIGVSFSVNEGKSFSTEVATFTSNSTKANNFHVSIAWGDGTTSAGSLVKSGHGFKVMGKHTYKNELNSSVVTTTITLASGANVQVSSTAKINGALVQSIPVTINAVEATDLSNLVVAKFRVVSKSITPKTSYSATVLFPNTPGDFGFISGQVVADPSIKNGYDVIVPSYVFQATTLPQGQPTGVQIMARIHPTVGEGIDISTNTVVTPPKFVLVQASPVTQTLGDMSQTPGPVLVEFADPAGEFNNPSGQGQGYRVKVDWGDKQIQTFDVTPTGADGSDVTYVVNPSYGKYAEQVFFAPPLHPYTMVGVYPVTITIMTVPRTAGALTETETYQTTATVTLPKPQLYPLLAYEGETEIGGGFKFTGPLGSGVLASFPDPNPANDRANYTTTIDWGDQTAIDTSATLAASPDGKSIEVDASHVYQLAGSYTITLNILDKNSGKVVSTSTEQVTVLAQPITYDTSTLNLDNMGNFSGSLLTFGTGPYTPASDLTATITWGDSTPNAMGIVTRTLPIGTSGMQFTVTGSHQFPIDGLLPGQTFNGSVVLSDSDGGAVVTIPVTFEFDPQP